MAKQANTRGTTKITTTKTTITKSTKGPATRKAARKRGNGGIIAGVVVILLILGAAAWLLMNSATPAQQRSQFANQLHSMQDNNQDIALFYLNNAPNYQLPVNQSWSVQITDQNPTNSTPIGQLTISWNGQSKSLSVQEGIVNTGISPTYAVTLPHSEFMSFSQAVITKNVAAALAYYSAYYLSGKLNYTRVS